jgi:hypothetical protein
VFLDQIVAREDFVSHDLALLGKLAMRNYGIMSPLTDLFKGYELLLNF